jgi:hypothetical protein
MTFALGLLAPLVLGIAIETYEIWVRYRDFGLLAPGNDPVWQIVARHGLDIVSMLVLPIVLVLVGTASSR